MDSRWSIRDACLIFLPLLLLYVVLVIAFSSGSFVGDEEGYVKIASRLAGHDSSTNEITLWWGPGYPIVLAPFVYFNIPWLYAKLLNAFFLFGAVVYLYLTLSLWLEKKQAIIFAFLFGLYPPLMREVHFLITESLVFFLVCGFAFHYCRLFRSSGRAWPHLLAASAYLGYLALTKVFFGYVITIGLMVFFVAYLLRRNTKYARTACMYLLAFIICLPYLFYTYSITNKVFYWGTSGGMSLYWMSAPYDSELGSWFYSGVVQKRPELTQHREFFDRISNLTEVEQDEEFKKQAIYNITHYPKRYIINWVANTGRLLFSYPFSYTQQKLTTYFYILPNMFIVVLFVLGVYPAVSRWKTIPFELRSLLFFAVVAFGGTSLLSAYDRQFRPFVPILVLWLCFIYSRVLYIKIRSRSEIDRL